MYDVLKVIGDEGRKVFDTLLEVDRVIFTAVCGVCVRLPGALSEEVNFIALGSAIARGVAEASSPSISVSAKFALSQILIDKDKIFKNLWFRTLVSDLISIIHTLHVV